VSRPFQPGFSHLPTLGTGLAGSDGHTCSHAEYLSLSHFRVKTERRVVNIEIIANPTLTSFATRPKVLVVDDDDNMVTLLKLALDRAGVRVLTANSGSQALRQTFEHRPDVVLLDIGMPNMDGFTVCQRLRDLSDLPIIMVTAFDGPEYVTRAFAHGADDYVTKPFDIAELTARIQVCLRRAPNGTEREETLVLGKGELIIDLHRHRVWVRQQDVHLTKTEFDLLIYLARNQGRVLTHGQIRSAIAVEDSVIGQASLKQFVSGLRKKIELDPRDPKWLVSEHGVGYALVMD
jgi:two-component system, OmpR family, KDP operon response regulator KdpE